MILKRRIFYTITFLTLIILFFTCNITSVYNTKKDKKDTEEIVVFGITNIAPTSGKEITKTQSLSLTYSKTINKSSISVTGSMVGVIDTIVSTDNTTDNKITVTPQNNWNLGNGMEITIECSDLKGTIITKNLTYNVNDITSDVTNPTVSITDPKNGDKISGIKVIKVDVTDDLQIDNVEFYLDGDKLNKDTSLPYEYSLDTTQYDENSYTIMVKAYDTSMNSATDSINVTIDNSYANTIRSNKYVGPNDQVFHVATSTRVDLSYDLDLQGYTKDVYFVFTNLSSSNSLISPNISSSTYSNYNRSNLSNTHIFNDNIVNRPIALRGTPEITEFNTRSFEYTSYNPENISSRSIAISPDPNFASGDTFNDTHTFMYNSTTSNLIPATCKKVVNATIGKSLNIWVADNCWDGYSASHPLAPDKKTYEVTQSMVDGLADSFLKQDSTDDIYSWISNIFGEEWGSHGYSNLITEAEANGEITILLYDIDNDNIPTGPFVMGFFWAKDNFKDSGTSSIAYSNERIMFYLDAVMYANYKNYDGSPGNGTWDETDYWPEEMISTLSHEFQHMIHYYQKGIKSGNGGYTSETWINEMCSMVAEDLIARKLQVNGPRGVSYLLGGAGSSNNENGRLPLFNKYNYISLTDWLSGSSVLLSYSINYAFGAYMARNFGGAVFFQDIVKYDGSNEERDYTIFNYALSKNGYSETFDEALQKWGAAVILSDLTDPTGDHYQYNKDDWFYSSEDGIQYDLGSINMYNYEYDSQNGPLIYTDTADFPSQMNGTSNLYYKAGSSISGKQNWQIRMDQDVKLTVIVR